MSDPVRARSEESSTSSLRTAGRRRPGRQLTDYADPLCGVADRISQRGQHVQHCKRYKVLGEVQKSIDEKEHHGKEIGVFGQLAIAKLVFAAEMGGTPE